MKAANKTSVIVICECTGEASRIAQHRTPPRDTPVNRRDSTSGCDLFGYTHKTCTDGFAQRIPLDMQCPVPASIRERRSHLHYATSINETCDSPRKGCTRIAEIVAAIKVQRSTHEKRLRNSSLSFCCINSLVSEAIKQV